MTRAKLIAILVICAFLSLVSTLALYHTHQLPTQEERPISLCTYGQVGRYNYTAKLKSNLIYNQSTLKPGEGILYTEITEFIDTTFLYTFRLSGLDRPANTTIEYSIDVYYESPHWRKRLNIVPKNTINSDENTVYFSADYLVNISSVEEIFRAIQSETGARTSEYNIAITPEIHTAAITDVGTIDEYFTPSMTMNFMQRTPEGDHILIEGLNHTSRGAITRTEEIYQPSVMNQRYASYAFSLAAFSALGWTAWMFTRTEPTRIERSLKGIIEPFKEIILEVAEEPSHVGQRVAVKTLEDLVNLADGLGKPVLHYERRSDSRERQPTHAFYVLDNMVRYEYTMTAPSIEEKADLVTVIGYEGEDEKQRLTE